MSKSDLIAQARRQNGKKRLNPVSRFLARARRRQDLTTRIDHSNPAVAPEYNSPARRVILYDGLETAITLNLGNKSDSSSIVVAKSRGSVVSLMIDQAVVKKQSVYLSSALTTEMYHSVPLLQFVPDSLKIELRHILESSVYNP